MTEDQTRRRILDAAAQVFAEKGYRGATTRALAAAAKVNEITLFRHFGSKKNLYEEMVRCNSALPELDAALQNQMSGDYRRDLLTLSGHFLRLMLERRQEILSSLCEAERQPELRSLIGSIPAQQRQVLGNYLRQQMARDVVRPLDAEMAAQALLGMFLAYSISLPLLPEHMAAKAPDEVLTQFVDLFIAGSQK